MSEEEKVEEVAQPGRIQIEVTEQNVKYDTNLPVPELTFWLEVVRQMVVKNVLEGDPNAGG